MKTFRYKGRQARYFYMLLFAAACLMPISVLIAMPGSELDPWGSLFYALLGITLILVSAYRLRERVIVSESWVRFVKDWPATIRFADITGIEFMRGETGFAVRRSDGSAVSHTIGRRDSEADIETLRQALAMIVERAKMANPGAQIDERAAAFVDGNSGYARQRLEDSRADRAGLKGLGGWLAAIAAFLFLSAAANLLDTFDLVTTILTAPANIPFLGTIRGVAGFASLALAVWTLIAFFRKKKEFSRDFLLYFAVSSVAALLSYCVSKFLASGTVAPEFAAVAVMNTAVYVIRLIALRAYTRQSLRVKNTFMRE